jgi:hypothetical protein
MLWTDGNVNQNVFNALLSGAGSPWSDADIADDAEAWLMNMYTNLNASQSDQIDGNEVIVYKYDPIDDDWDEVSSQSFAWNPSSTAEQLPRGTAPLIQLWTEDPDVQGKKYIPGSTEAALTDGLYTSAHLIDLLAFAADWFTPFAGGTSGATWNPGVWSVAQTAFKTGVDHIAASAIPAYQRRRKRNVGI